MTATTVRLTATVTPAALARFKTETGLDLTAADLAHLLTGDLRRGLVGQTAGADMTITSDTAVTA